MYAVLFLIQFYFLIFVRFSPGKPQNMEVSGTAEAGRRGGAERPHGGT